VSAERAEPVSGWRLRLAELSFRLDFNRLWAGMSVSQLGGQVTLLALPLTGVVTLHASAAQMGALSVVARVPFLLYPLAGVWVDRARRRRVMIGSDLVRAAILLAVPLAAALGVLRMEVLYAALFLVMLFTVVFDTAYQSFLPALVGRERLLEANSKLAMTGSAARIAGPSLGGVLVQLITAPFAVVVNALTFLFSALMIALIRTRDPAPQPAASRGAFHGQLLEGMRYVLSRPVLRALAVAVGLTQFAWALQLAVYLLYITRDLHVPPAWVGLIVATAGPATLVGSVVASRLSRRLGLGRTVFASWVAFAAAGFLVPLAPGSALPAAAALLVASQLVGALAQQVAAVNVASVRQAIPPDRMKGRVNASFNFVALGVAPFGSLAGGLLGTFASLRETELVAAAGMLLAPVVIALSVVPRLRELPQEEAA
jgi:MFS family permease